MLTMEENDLLTRTGPGTPMGEVMRRYWVPALLSWEVEPDGPPVRVKLLSETLIAFRDASGRVGVIEEHCAHRKASLWFGRNEEDGLRCVFHGWKYDVAGNCVDQPNEPPQYCFKDKIHLKAYPTVELGGIVWAFMGPKEKMPPPPRFEAMQAPASHLEVTKTWEECNWLQALEGGMDTAHISFLHWGLPQRSLEQLPPESPRALRARARSPEVEVDVTDYGYRYAGVRPIEGLGDYVRGYHFVMPWTQLRPTQIGGGFMLLTGGAPWIPTGAGHFWVPMDDENCMVWNWQYSFGESELPDHYREDDSSGPENTYYDDWFRKKRNRENAYLIDRRAQRADTFTGIAGINTQDHAIQESMGSIADRTTEHLGSTDRAVVVARQLLLKAIRTVREGGDPPGTSDSYYTVRPIERTIPSGADWREALLPEMYPA